MEAVIDANTPLDCIEFHIFPSQNRYEAWACYLNKKEEVTSGLLENLLLHSAEARAQRSKGSSVKYNLRPPENNDIKWFTKSTLIRFLHIIDSANILDITNSMKSEISQLEEARRFHLSLHEKDYQLQYGESDNGYSSCTVSTPKAEDSDVSKNEFLRAMDLRLTALRGELTAAFDQAAGSRYSLKEMTDIEKFSCHFGAVNLRDSLRKHIELRQGQGVENSGSKQFSESDRVRAKDGYKNAIKSLSSEPPVKYGVSPAKVALVERQSSTESDESSFSSEEEQPSIDRSRNLVRSALPRRSASPMRRIQVGRSGSRRSTAITVKSLNFPTRERSFLPKDTGNDTAEEGPEEAPKKTEVNVKRMSVQDAINLFESKQRDQTADVREARSLLSECVAADKSVVRRWSSGVGDDSSQYPQDLVSEDAVPQIHNNLESREISNSSPEAEAEPGFASEDCPIEPCGFDVKLNSPEKRACSPVIKQEETNASDQLTASSEWSRQKEAELNDLLMKMMETKPAKIRSVVPNSSKRQSLPAEQRGGFYDHYKEKRDEKLRGETARKKAEKDKQFRAMQQTLDARKSQLTSASAGDAVKNHNVKKPQKSQKNASEPANPKTESSKLGVVKKASPKVSSLPAIRKSWPSTPSGPSPRAPGASPAKIPVASSSTGTNPSRRRSQPVLPVSRSSPKLETSQPRAKSIIPNQNNSKNSLKSATGKKQHPVIKPRKTEKSKVQSAPEDLASSAKPSLYNKVTKKGSVVPLESKPFLRKGSGTISNVNPVVKTKASSNPQELLRSSEDLILAEEDETISNSSNPVIQHQKRELGELKLHMGMESGTCAKSAQRCEDEGFIQVNPTIDYSIDRSSEDLILADENEAVSNSSSPVILHQETELGEFKIHMGMESVTPAKRAQKCEDEGFVQVIPTIDDSIDRAVEPELKPDDSIDRAVEPELKPDDSIDRAVESELKADAEEESTISPSAWVEIEEHVDQPVMSSEHNCQIGSPTYIAPVEVRVRHSLSQMLLEETSEPDSVDWGNAENPPPMVYQKDAPKGLKRLLKFARKSKTDANSTGWSSLSVVSEGEDDAEDSTSSENLLKKATLHSWNNGHQKAYATYQKNSTDYEHPAQSNISKFSGQSLSQKLQEGHVSASVTTTKASRSFFSLSAFKGSK